MLVTFAVSVPRARTCCRVWSTQTGSLIIAAVYIVLSIMIAVPVIYLTATPGMWLGLGFTLPPLIYSTLCIIGASLMIHGIRKGRCRLMLPWIMLQVVYGMFFPVALCGYKVLAATGLIIGCIIIPHVYFIFVVYCYYEELRLHEIGAAMPPTINVDIPNLNTCCLAWSTRKGSFFIGAIYTALSMLLAAGIIFCFVSSCWWRLEIILPPSAYSLASLVTGPIMIYGIRKEKYHLIQPWIILQVILAIFLPGFAITFYRDRNTMYGPLLCCIILPHIYLTSVVYSYCEEIRTRHTTNMTTTEQGNDPLV